MIFTDFKPYHARKIHLQDDQKDMESLITIEHALSLETSGPAWTVLSDSGVVLACGGMATMWAGRAIAWTLLSSNITPREFIAIDRFTRKKIEESGMRRIEMTVREGHENGIRWAKSLGFKLETPEPMRGFAPDGSAHYLFARVI